MTMPSDNHVRESLLKLAANRDRISIARLWRAMTVAERERGLRLALDDMSDAEREVLVHAVAKARNFRPQSVSDWDTTRLASAGSRIVDLGTRSVARSAIVALHVKDRTTMLTEFLDAVHIRHERGIFVGDEALETPVGYDDLMNAANSLTEHYDSDQVALYLLALRAMYPHTFGAVDAWLEHLLEDGSSQRSRSAISISAEQPAVVTAPIGLDTFTTLDNRLIRSIVDTAAGVEGAMKSEEIDDLLLEIAQLNSTRHRTLFHLGYRDALFKATPASKLDAENEARRRWYWAGYISGIARQDRWKDIADLFDHETSVRVLGREGDGPSNAAGWLVFRALCKTGRYGEASAFVSEASVRSSVDLQRELLATATDIIRRDRAVDARRMLDILWEVAPAEEDESAFNRWLRLSRARALCLRQLGEQSEALELLNGLVDVDDPQLTAIARTDIGLVKAKIRRLGELALPAKRDELQLFLDRLDEGREDFEAALTAPQFIPAHASFALGVLALASDRYAEAAQRLDSALSYFSTQPEVYSLDGTLALAQLYLGASLCLALDEGSPARACDLIRQGLEGGAMLPIWLVRSTIDALDMTRSDLAYETASRILERGGDAVLTELIPTSPARNSLAIRSALFRRAAHPSRSIAARAADYLVVIPWLLSSHEIEKAQDALAFLEDAALKGVGTELFLELLLDSKSYSPAWDIDRALHSRIQLYESEGRYEEAAALLEPLCHRLLASDRDDDIDEGFLAFAQLEGYGPSGAAAVNRLRPRIDAISAQLQELEAGRERSEEETITPLHVLVVGGEKELSQYDESIKDSVAERFPGVTVEFLHTGWSGNWATYAADFERRLPHADGVVFLRLMRTMLGRATRTACNVPRTGSRGRGKGAILDAISRLIPMARSHMAVVRLAMHDE